MMMKFKHFQIKSAVWSLVVTSLAVGTLDWINLANNNQKTNSWIRPIRQVYHDSRGTEIPEYLWHIPFKDLNPDDPKNHYYDESSKTNFRVVERYLSDGNLIEILETDMITAEKLTPLINLYREWVKNGRKVDDHYLTGEFDSEYPEPSNPRENNQPTEKLQTNDSDSIVQTDPNENDTSQIFVDLTKDIFDENIHKPALETPKKPPNTANDSDHHQKNPDDFSKPTGSSVKNDDPKLTISENPSKSANSSPNDNDAISNNKEATKTQTNEPNQQILPEQVDQQSTENESQKLIFIIVIAASLGSIIGLMLLWNRKNILRIFKKTKK